MSERSEIESETVFDVNGIEEWFVLFCLLSIGDGFGHGQLIDDDSTFVADKYRNRMNDMHR